MASSSIHAKVANTFARYIEKAKELGIVEIEVDDIGSGDTISVEGSELINLGNCSYLGLNTDARVKKAAIEAVERFTPFYASSARYAAPSLYGELKAKLQLVMGGPCLIGTTTTLTHLGALPVLVTARDYVLVDIQAHATVQMATELLKARSIPVEMLPHNDMAVLESRIEELKQKHRKIWYLADGVYSMYGDTAPFDSLRTLLDKHDSLHLYLDDAHGVAWAGQHGRGLALEAFSGHDRVVVAAGLAKGFGSGGAVLAFSDAAMPEYVGRRGSTFTFSGPIPSANLGAAVRSAEIMLSPEGQRMQGRLQTQIAHTRELLRGAELQAVDDSATPIWFVPVGSNDDAMAVTRNLLELGFFSNVSFFPAVPRDMAGVRFTNSLSLSSAQVESFIIALAESVTKVIGPKHSYTRELVENRAATVG